MTTCSSPTPYWESTGSTSTPSPGPNIGAHEKAARRRLFRIGDPITAWRQKQHPPRPKQRQLRRRQQPQRPKRQRWQRKQPLPSREQQPKRQRLQQEQQLLRVSCRKRPKQQQQPGKPTEATFSYLSSVKGSDNYRQLWEPSVLADPQRIKARKALTLSLRLAHDCTQSKGLPYSPKFVAGKASSERCKSASRLSRTRISSAGSNDRLAR